MNYRFIIAYMTIWTNGLSTLYASNPPLESSSRVIIYNNHKISQTITTSSNEYPSRNRYPGHTKNETTTHRVNITPLLPKTDSATDTPTLAVDNTHTIKQNAHHAATYTRSIDPLLPDEVLPASNEHNYKLSIPNPSWLAAFIPPIITQSSSIQYALGGLCLGYVAFMAKLLHTSYFTLTKNNTWSSWNATVPIETIRSHEKEFAKELFNALQNFYINAPINACFLSPLVHFINDVDKELNQLTTFISMHKVIDKLHLMFIFPLQQKALDIAHEKTQRLEYFKSIIINWVGEYKSIKCS